MYDFHKVKQDNDMLVFKNPMFCRGEQHKLRFIKRKAAKKNGTRRYLTQPDLERSYTVFILEFRHTNGSKELWKGKSIIRALSLSERSTLLTIITTLCFSLLIQFSKAGQN
jgi:hypothetical protein